MSSEVHAAALLDEHGDLAAHTGVEPDLAAPLETLAGTLFDAAATAGARAGLEPVGRVEVTRPEGGVFGVRGADRAQRRWTLVAVTATGALSSLVFYDMRMVLLAMGGGR